MDFDFNVKKLVGEAGSFISRAVQMTEEVLYSGEKTALDPGLDKLCRQAEETKNWTQRLIKDTDALLVPNPGYRVEDYVLEKMDKKRPARQNNFEFLGQGMLDAGAEFGRTTAYGSMLIKVGETEVKLGRIEREFIQAASSAFTSPLNQFMETEVKNYNRERKVLENKRLDLDVAKNKLRKARSMSSTAPTAEAEVITCQSEFTAQTNLIRQELEVLLAARDRHVENLKALVTTQQNYYDRCSAQLTELSHILHSMPLENVSLNQSFSLDDGESGNPGAFQQAKVMYDVAASAPDHLNLHANEFILVAETDDMDYFTGRKGTTEGKVPKASVLLL